MRSRDRKVSMRIEFFVGVVATASLVLAACNDKDDVGLDAGESPATAATADRSPSRRTGPVRPGNPGTNPRTAGFSSKIPTAAV